MDQQQFKEDLTASMKKRDTTRTEVIRSILTALTNELVAGGKRPDDELSTDEVNKVLNRLAKQRRDSIEQFKKGGRDELANKEKAELEILEEYLPEQMSEEDIQKVVDEKLADIDTTDSSNKGKVMGALMKELSGKADGKVVKRIVDESFGG